MTVEQTFTVGTRAIPTGGGFLLGNQIMADQSHIQNRDPKGDAYVTARSSNARCRFDRADRAARRTPRRLQGRRDMPVFTVEQGTLAPGDTVTFTYGDSCGGSKGSGCRR